MVDQFLLRKLSYKIFDCCRVWKYRKDIFIFLIHLFCSCFQQNTLFTFTEVLIPLIKVLTPKNYAFLSRAVKNYNTEKNILYFSF